MFGRDFGKRVDIVTTLIFFVFYIFVEMTFHAMGWKIVAFIGILWYGNKIAGYFLNREKSSQTELKK